MSACSACCIGHILIGLEYRLVATVSVYIIHVCVSVSACGVSVCVSVCVVERGTCRSLSCN